jgi:hypothetical protein
MKAPEQKEGTLPVAYLHCNSCGKQVSTGYVAIPTQTPDRGLIIRAWIECPECIEAKILDELRTHRCK